MLLMARRDILESYYPLSLVCSVLAVISLLSCQCQSGDYILINRESSAILLFLQIQLEVCIIERIEGKLSLLYSKVA